jgi:hypothetical protein
MISEQLEKFKQKILIFKKEYKALNKNDHSRVKTILDGAGCEILLG